MSQPDDLIRDVDVPAALTAKSDQINADDLLGGPRLVRIGRVRRGGSPEQPWDVEVVDATTGEPWRDPTRPTVAQVWRPCKTVRRLLVAVWGATPATWAGRRARLVRDPGVTFGGVATGGIRVDAVSHVDRRRTVAVLVARGRRGEVAVDPLPDEAPAADPMAALLAEYAIDPASLRGWLATPDAAGAPRGRAALAAWLRADLARLERVQTWRPPSDASAVSSAPSDGGALPTEEGA